MEGAPRLNQESPTPYADECPCQSEDLTRIQAELLAEPPGQVRRRYLVNQLVVITAQTVGLSIEEVDPDEPLAALGLDSAQILALRSSLEERFAVELPATIGWQYPTLSALAPHLAERIGVDLDARTTDPHEGDEAVVPQGRPGVAVGHSDVLADLNIASIGALSDEDFTELLAKLGGAGA